MHALLDTPAVTAAGHDLSVGEVVLAGVRSGAWQAFEARVRAGLARRDAEPPPGALKAAAVTWRRERGLIAGDELDAWLEQHAVDKAEWSAFLRRRATAGAGVAAGSEPGPDDVLAHLRVEALCDGVLTDLVQELIVAAGAHAALAETETEVDVGPDEAAVADLVERARACTAPLADLPDLEERARTVVALETARERFAAERVRDRDVARLLEDRRLDWADVAWEEAAFATKDAALEAAMLVREDGLSLTEAAQLADAPLTQARMKLGEVGGELGPVLVAARAGDVLGPRNGDGVFRLVAVVERVNPSLDDPELVRRARDELLTEGLTRHLAGAVTWHGAL